MAERPNPGPSETDLASVIICTCDRVPRLRLTLEALGAQEVPPPLKWELLVVDNGSDDSAADVLHGCPLPTRIPTRYLRQPRRGQARARNLGMAAARGAFILFTDDDILPSKNWLANLCAPLLRGEADAAVGKVRLAPHLNRPWMNKDFRAWLADTEALDAREPSRMVGANMAFCRTVLDRVPAFDPELGPGALGYGEDTLFSLQVRAAGYKIAGVPEATVEHHFDDQRLRRGQWIDTARRMGWVDAYLAHHWEHSVWSRPAIHALVARLRLAAWRARFSKHAFAMEYVPERLLQATRHCHARLRYLRERRRPRNYARHGLARLDSRQEHGSMLQALPVEQ